VHDAVAHVQFNHTITLQLKPSMDFLGNEMTFFVTAKVLVD
jgi:hypothetical protein